MNRRESLKAISLATAAGVLLDACKPSGETKTAEAASAAEAGRQPFEAARDKALAEQKFFDAHEMATIAVLVDLIIPRDERSGSATDAKVPEFIEFIVKDEPEHQLPMRGGLRWLDVKCLNLYNNDFKSCNPQQQEEILSAIAYPAIAKPGMQAGVAFFNKMRDLTAIGFFTSKMGIEDLGYKGNTPNVWRGVPAEVLKQYGLENV
ncbi:MAG TPA: gluconate 2-dehydrogenase subunit 3 family protein [Chitinophagaceae bacterium]|nr:gluconate 2-dehydrogenase subunit 3 family protein [Chitinophagaceae bacterium]